jgi:small subunit ribosomal protein S19e
MKWVSQVEKNELIVKASEELKKTKEIVPPSWALFVKTGTHKERPPVDEDWWYKRAAAVLLKTEKLGPIGVSKLRTHYGGKKRRGHQPAEFRKGSGNILRKVLQQLEKAGYLKQQAKGIHKGRVLTAKGQSFLNTIAKSIANVPSKAKKPKNGEPKPAKLAKPAKGTAAAGAADSTPREEP